MENALCREHDPELFFPQGKAGNPIVRRREVEVARRVCAECPLSNRRECAAIALDTDASDGVWAGVDFGDTPHTRSAARKALALIAGRGQHERGRRNAIPDVCLGVCGRRLRAARTRIEDAPGTVQCVGNGRCVSCLRLWRGRPARPELVAS